MRSVDIGNPWIHGALLVVVWMVVWSVMEVALFDGQLLRAVVVGGAGGLAFAVTFTFVKRQEGV